MKNIKGKLAAIVGLSVLFTLAAVLTVFNYTMRRQMEHKARIALNSVFDWDDIDWNAYEADSVYLPTLVVVDSAFCTAETEGVYPQQEKVVRWCREHRELGINSHVKLGTRSYYIQIGANGYMPGDGMFTIAFVDATGEESLIRNINIMFLFITAVMGAGGAFVGYIMGNQIEQSQAAQKRFYENMSHELKTPLTSIRGYAEGLETGVLVDSRQAAQVIGGEAQKMAVLVEEILCLARLESGAVRLHREPICIAEFVENCLLPMEGIIQNRGLQVELNIGPGSVSADLDQMEHAFMNLLTNAVKYAASKILVNYNGKELTVWNDGDGLSDINPMHVFERFYTGNGGNIGIGLALTKEIILLHGWKISAKKSDGGIGFIIDVLG